MARFLFLPPSPLPGTTSSPSRWPSYTRILTGVCFWAAEGSISSLLDGQDRDEDRQPQGELCLAEQLHGGMDWGRILESE